MTRARTSRRGVCPGAGAVTRYLTGMPRRFPPPWTVEEADACFIVRDHNGQALATSTLRRSRRAAAKLLTRDARRVTRPTSH
jgi:hypothetical protein